jgi:hypothetical protein
LLKIIPYQDARANKIERFPARGSTAYIEISVDSVWFFFNIPRRTLPRKRRRLR